MFLVGTSIDLYTPSMPSMAIALHSDTFHIKNTISIYFIFFALGQIIFGTLSYIFGRRPILLLGIVVFVIASFFAARTDSVTVLLIMRAIQIFSAASPSVVCKALLVDTRKREVLTKAYTYTAMIWGAGPLIAPFIGGYIHHFLGWQANFYTFSIYGTLWKYPL